MRLVLLLAAGVAWMGGAQSIEDRAALRKLNQEAAAAHERKDYAAFLELTRQVAEKAPRSISARYNLACAQALAGAPTEAIATLERLADRGVAFDMSSDPDLDSLRDSPAFQAVAGKMSDLQKPLGASLVAFTLPDKTLITEGVAFDPKSGDFFVSSIRQRKIVRVSKDGTAKDFLEPRAGFYSIVALEVDSSKNVLWASSHASPRMEGYREEDDERSFVVELDLDTAKVLRRIETPTLTPPAHFSDLAVGPRGDLAIADPYTGRIYLVSASADGARVLVDAGPLASPQGMAWSPDGASLFVADYSQGIAKVRVSDGSVRILDAPKDAVVTGIDGLIWAEGSLVGIQNGVQPHRVARHRLDASLDRVEDVTVLERGHPSFDEPTLGVRVGSELYYVANSQYRFVGDDGTLVLDRLQLPVILRAPLPWIR